MVVNQGVLLQAGGGNLADVFLLVEPTIGGAIRCGLYTQQRRSGYVIV
jgi:hypothetical protein